VRCYCFARRCRNSDERKSVREEIAYILERIQEDLLRGFLVVPLRDDDNIWSAAIIVTTSNTTFDDERCPSGSYRTENICCKYTLQHFRANCLSLYRLYVTPFFEIHNNGVFCIQSFDTVCWTAGRASGL